MTHSGGKPHAVGDKGQRFEVSVYDEAKGERVVLGWSDDAKVASEMAASAEIRPSWKFANVRDRTVKLK